MIHFFDVNLGLDHVLCCFVLIFSDELLVWTLPQADDEDLAMALALSMESLPADSGPAGTSLQADAALADGVCCAGFRRGLFLLLVFICLLLV